MAEQTDREPLSVLAPQSAFNRLGHGYAKATVRHRARIGECPSSSGKVLRAQLKDIGEPNQIAKYVDTYLDEGEKKLFSDKASLIVKNMDNPVRLIIDEIRGLYETPREEATLKRRSKMEIRIDIIQSTSLRPLRTTHIMKAANISYTELKTIVDDLERSGLISMEVTLGGKYYQATSEGLKVLQDYKLFKERLFS